MFGIRKVFTSGVVNNARKTTTINPRSFLLKNNNNTNLTTKSTQFSTQSKRQFSHDVPKLTFPKANGVLPFLSKRNMEAHYEHVTSLTRKYNELVAGTQWENYPFDVALKSTIKRSDDAALFHYASELYNHSIFFKSIFPGGVAPSPQMEEVIKLHFGGYLSFVDRLRHYCYSIRGQGWVWVLEEEGNISIEVSHQYQHPIARSANIKPLLALDMWEHSYYLDYLHKVDPYISNFVKVINWKFVEDQLRIDSNTTNSTQQQQSQKK